MKTLQNYSTEEAVLYVCATVKNLLEEDIKRNGSASLILTGGKSVRPFLIGLGKLEIDWSRIWIVLSDERWIPETDAKSNEKQLKDLLLDNLVPKANYISLKTNHSTPEEAIAELTNNLRSIPSPFACSLLSMGEDGHLASLFPDKKETLESEEEVLATEFDSVPRVSLGINTLLKSRSSMILVHGCKKISFLENLKGEYPLKSIFERSLIIKINEEN